MEGNHNLPQKAIVIFTKVPQPGLVKTRLSEGTVLTENDAAKIAEAMLKDIIILASKIKNSSICLGFFPQNKKKNIEQLLQSIKHQLMGSDKIYFFSQSGTGFDERFSSILTQVFNFGFEYSLVLGADLPYLNPDLLNYAFKELMNVRESKKIILGPAGGGGVYLLGVSRQFNPKWITEYKLFEMGVELLQFVKLSKLIDMDLTLLPPLIDIDIEEDLVSLLSYIEAIPISKKKGFYHFPEYTAEILKNLKLSIEHSPNETRKIYIKKLENP